MFQPGSLGKCKSGSEEGYRPASGMTELDLLPSPEIDMDMQAGVGGHFDVQRRA